MGSKLHLHYQFHDNRQLAHHVIDRFEQLLILLPLCCDDEQYSKVVAGNVSVSLGTKPLISLKLPDAAQQVVNITTVVRCLINPPSLSRHAIWLGVSIIDDNEFDVEQRIRRLTHDNSHEYGRILAEVFA